MVIKCNPKDIVDTYVLVDITGCTLNVEPLCHGPDHNLINEDGSPIFWELLATHLSVPMRWVTRRECMKDGRMDVIKYQIPITCRRLCFFKTREEAYDALARIQDAIVNGDAFVDLS